MRNDMKKLEIKLVECPLDSFISRGWGNGYVILPKNHPFHGVDYNILNDYVDAHGGLTYSDFNKENEWMVGFDTAHYMDTLQRWPESAVLEETERLRDQLETLGEKYTKEEVVEIVNEYYKKEDEIY